MAKKKNQLPSGNYRIQVYDYTDSEGKRHYRSFTGASKREAQIRANEWKVNKTQRIPENITVYEAIEKYIAAKQNVLSPSSIKTYKDMLRIRFSGPFGGTKLSDLTNRAIQIWVSELSANLSPKTVRNAFWLLSSALDMFAPDFRIKVTLPANIKSDFYCPSDEDIKKLLDCVQGTELEIAVMLAAFGPLRRGEICALTDEDIIGDTIVVRKSMVKDENGKYVIKPNPKTYGSYREIKMPDIVIEKISGIKGRIVQMTPETLTSRFEHTINRININKFRFHDLRHYSASMMHAIGVPDQYILQRGGWTNDHVMKTVYRNVIDIEKEKQNRKINEHFSELEIV